MEAVAAAASVAGILSLTIHGIQTINSLCSLYNHCTDEVTQTFIHELTVSARILTDVKNLCDKVEHTDSRSRNEIRLATLRIQVEDCTADLELWLRTARRIDDRATRLNRNKFIRKLGSTHDAPRRQIVTLINAVLKTSMTVVTKSARVAVQDSFRKHQYNVQIALSMLGRDFDLSHTHRLQDLDTRLEDLSTDLSEHHEILREVSSSGSSNLAWSKSHDARLRDLQSLYSSLSDKLEHVLETMSLQNSQSSSQLGEVDAQSLSCKNHQAVGKPAQLLLSKGNAPQVEPEDSHTDHDEVEGLRQGKGFTAKSLDDHEQHELQHILRLYMDFKTIATQCFDPIIGEYVVKAQEWQILKSRTRMLEFMKNSRLTPQIVFDRTYSDLASDCARQLLALRSRALDETLDESLKHANELFGYGDVDVHGWRLLIEQESGDDGVKLQLPNEPGSISKANERLTRTNEWLLKQMYSNPHLAELHRTILAEMTMDSTVSSYERRDMWQSDMLQRQVVKYWFLDSAGTTGGEYASSVNFDSDITILGPSTEDSETRSPVEDQPRDTEVIMLRQPSYPPLANNMVARTMELENLNQAPEGISTSKQARAVQALQEYSQEPTLRPQTVPSPRTLLLSRRAKHQARLARTHKQMENSALEESEFVHRSIIQR